MRMIKCEGMYRIKFTFNLSYSFSATKQLSREQPIAVKLAHSGTNKSSKKKTHNNTLDEEDTLARLGILQLSQIIQLINLFISSE